MRLGASAYELRCSSGWSPKNPKAWLLLPTSMVLLGSEEPVTLDEDERKRDGSARSDVLRDRADYEERGADPSFGCHTDTSPPGVHTARMPSGP